MDVESGGRKREVEVDGGSQWMVEIVRSAGREEREGEEGSKGRGGGEIIGQRGTDLQYAVGVDVEGHFDLRHAPRHGRNAIQVKLAQNRVVLGELALPLEHLGG